MVGDLGVGLARGSLTLMFAGEPDRTAGLLAAALVRLAGVPR
jgi:hypothetical protein